MTTFSAVTNSEIAVGAPITNNLKTKERDNLLAIQENDPTAPTIAFATAAGTAGTAGTITNQGALATLDSVGSENINWSNAEGIQQEVINEDVIAVIAGAWTTVKSIKIYIPTDANSLEYLAEMKNSSGGIYYTYFRLSYSGADGGQILTNSTSYVYASTGVLDISAASGWTTINLQTLLTSTQAVGDLRYANYRII